jgi:hypothetical protein
MTTSRLRLLLPSLALIALTGLAAQAQSPYPEAKQGCITGASLFAFSVAPSEAIGFADVTVQTVVSFANVECSSGQILVEYRLDGAWLGDSENALNAYPITFAVPDGFTYRFQIIVTDLVSSETFTSTTAPIRVDVGPPILRVEPSTLVNFGNVVAGESKDVTFTISNAGGGSLAGTATVGSPFQILGSSNFVANASSSQQMTVRFTPPFISSFQTQIFFNAGEGGFLQVTLRGNGVSSTIPLQIDARDQATEAAIVHAVVRVARVIRVDGVALPDNQLEWELRSRTSDAFYNFVLPEPGEYKTVINANGYDTVTSIDTLAPGTTQETYSMAFTGNNSDADGDGLRTVDEETLFLTNPQERDTDGDGMSDLFELEYEFDPRVDPNNPQDPSDPDGNPDQDSFTNLQESILRTNPRDDRSPAEDRFYASPTGSDSEGIGTRAAPWSTINGALAIIYDEVGIPEGQPVTLVLLPGAYLEDVQLVANLTIVGDQPNNAVIEGRLQGAPGAVLENLRIREPETKQEGALLTVADENMRIQRVAFGGATASVAAGMTFDGIESATAVVANCSFAALQTGIKINGSLPRIRLSTFQNLGEDGIVIEDTEVPLGDNTLGDSTDPNSGWNVFRENGNLAVNNLRAEQVVMENNDWGTEDPAEVRELIAGPADFEPFVPPGLAPASLTCTVEDVVTRDRITAATVTLNPANVPPLSDNVEGIYNFAAMVPDVYNVRVDATGFLPVTLLNQDLSGGGTATLLFSLQREGDEPEGKDSDAACGPIPVSGGGYGSDMLVMLGAVIVLLVAARRRYRVG